jgi:hypothetical protein
LRNGLANLAEDRLGKSRRAKEQRLINQAILRCIKSDSSDAAL